jgi:small subunit ribosomal protein S4
MGQIKRLRKKYETPMHPWQKDRLIEEKEYILNYGFKNKKEIWKEIAKLKKARAQAKRIIANKSSEQAQKEKVQLLDRLIKFGVLTKDATVEDVLGLKATNFFERRLQTLIVRRGLARSVTQARQFIVHGHILVDNQKISSPSYMVASNDESKISFNSSSALSKEDHPERAVLTKKDEAILEEIKAKKKEAKEEKTTKKKEAKPSKKEEIKDEVKEEIKEELQKEGMKEKVAEKVAEEVKEESGEEITKEVTKKEEPAKLAEASE